jgi:hypothetical protein
MGIINSGGSIRVPWNEERLVDQKAPFKPQEIWASRRPGVRASGRPGVRPLRHGTGRMRSAAGAMEPRSLPRPARWRRNPGSSNLMTRSTNTEES